MESQDDLEPTSPANPADSAETEAAASEGSTGDDELHGRVVAALKECYDPEIPVDVYELGLIYKIDIDPAGACAIDMTLTSPACPVAGTLPPDVEQRVGAVSGITSSKVEVVWDPPWSPERMSEAAKLELDMF